jgi:hypothetical protein
MDLENDFEAERLLTLVELSDEKIAYLREKLRFKVSMLEGLSPDQRFKVNMLEGLRPDQKFQILMRENNNRKVFFIFSFYRYI